MTTIQELVGTLLNHIMRDTSNLILMFDLLTPGNLIRRHKTLAMIFQEVT